MDHYYSENPTSEFEVFDIVGHVGTDEMTLYSSNGIFSKKRFDICSIVLIENCDVKSGDKVLDFGCGYGLIGIYVAKLYGADVMFSDVNNRAVELTRMNCKRHKIKGKIVQSDIFGNVEGKFDVILLNPPQTAGKKVCLKMIEESYDHLNHGGSLQIVARHNKGGKGFSEFMEEIFGNVETLVKTGGKRVYKSVLK